MAIRRLIGPGKRGLRMVSDNKVRRIRVAVISDVRVVRDALERLLGDEPTLRIITAGSVIDAGRDCQGNCEVLVLDATSVNLESLQEMPQLAESRVVAFGLGGRDEDAILRCARAGVRVFVPGDATASELVDAIHAASRNEVRCPPELARAILHDRTQSASVGIRLSALTEREAHIALLVENGLSNQQIAATLNIAVSTVKNHVHSILVKLQTRGRRETAALVRRAHATRIRAAV